MEYRIAVVDDEPLSLTNAKKLLKEQGMKADCFRSGADLLKYLNSNVPDLILLDIIMPEMDGFQVYRAVRDFEKAHGLRQIPIVFLSGESSGESERAGLGIGASDYIHKPFNSEILISRIRNCIQNNRTIETLMEEANTDRLTGFFNKVSGTERIAKCCRQNTGTLMVVDLDNFKLVNDLYGHDMGDKVLIRFADIIKEKIRNDDVISRIGGDEFMVFLGGVNDEEALTSMVGRLNEELVSVAEVLMGEEMGVPLGLSAGAVIVSREESDFEELFSMADSALYSVKQNGKHGCAVAGRFDEPANASDDDTRGDLFRISKILDERVDSGGAMMLGQDMFSVLYRYIMRFNKQFSKTAVKLLFTLKAVGKEMKGDMLEPAGARFSKIIRKELRSSDIVLHYRAEQFFIVLPMCTAKEADAVAERIVEIWRGTEYAEHIDVEYVTEEAGA